MGTITLADEEDSGFFGIACAPSTSVPLLTAQGPSSNVSFTRHLCRAIGSCTTLDGTPTGLFPDTPAYDGGFVSASRPPSPPGRIDGLRFDQRGKDIFKLPPVSETLSLIKQYFTNTGLLFPYIHPPTFLQTYEEMVQDSSKRVRRTWLGLLNMVLAMVTITASPYDAPANTRAIDSDVFYQRSLGLCRDEILRGTTLEVGGFPAYIHPQSSCIRLSDSYSTIPTPYGPIPAGNTEVGPGVDRAWSSGQGGSSARTTL